jgi:hypothetical protein
MPWAARAPKRATRIGSWPARVREPLQACPRRWFAVGDAVTMVVPGMGDSITEGEIAEWQVQVGAVVSVDDVLVEIETDKVTSEVKATFPGTVSELLAAEGDTVSVNQALITITEGEGGAAPQAAPPAAPTAPAAAPPATASPPEVVNGARKRVWGTETPVRWPQRPLDLLTILAVSGVAEGPASPSGASAGSRGACWKDADDRVPVRGSRGTRCLWLPRIRGGRRGLPPAP